MSDSYVTCGAVLRCSKGSSPSKLNVPVRKEQLTGSLTANVADTRTFVNIQPFGTCYAYSEPTACKPGIIGKWKYGKDDYLIEGEAALLKSSYCSCGRGGIITIKNDGQKDTGPADLSKDPLKTEEEINKESEEKTKLTPEEMLDGIQLALDMAGFAPGIGAIPDILNAGISALRGDWAAAGLCLLAAVPAIGDAAAAAKLARKGMKAAKTAKKTQTAMGQKFLSLTAKSPQQPTPSKMPDIDFGKFTHRAERSAGNTNIKVDIPVQKPPVKEYPEDSWKKILEYKGNQPKPKDGGNNLDIIN